MITNDKEMKSAIIVVVFNIKGANVIKMKVVKILCLGFTYITADFKSLRKISISISVFSMGYLFDIFIQRLHIIALHPPIL